MTEPRDEYDRGWFDAVAQVRRARGVGQDLDRLLGIMEDEGCPEGRAALKAVPGMVKRIASGDFESIDANELESILIGLSMTHFEKAAARRKALRSIEYAFVHRLLLNAQTAASKSRRPRVKRAVKP